MSISAQQYLSDLFIRHSQSVSISSVTTAFAAATKKYTQYQALQTDEEIITKYAYSAELQVLITTLSLTNEWKTDEFEGDREINRQRFILLQTEFADLGVKIMKLYDQHHSQQHDKHHEPKTQSILVVDENIRDKVLSQTTKWPYTTNGINYCAFLAYLSSLAVNPSYISFFSQYKPEQPDAEFCTNLFNLYHDAFVTSVNNQSSKLKWKRILQIIGNQIKQKDETLGTFFTIAEALKILDFDSSEIISALQRADVGAGNSVTLNFCSNGQCQRIMDGVGASIKQNVSYSDFDIEQHVIPLIENSESFMIESNLSCIFSETNILAGGHPMGKCSECNHTKFSVIFRHPSATNSVTFGHSLGLYSNFELSKLNDIPVIGLDGLIYKYQANTLYINKPVNTHWFDAVINWDNKTVVKLNSSGGEVAYHDWDWLEQQKPYIAGMLLVKKNVPPINTIDPLELILSAVETCKLTSHDVKHFQPKFLTKLMEDRNIWELFAAEVSTRKYYSKVKKKVKGKTIKPGDRINFNSEEERLAAKIFTASEYRQTCSVKNDRLTDIMIVWTNNYEQNWAQSHASLTMEQSNIFKAKLMSYWNNEGNNNIENIIIVAQEMKSNETEITDSELKHSIGFSTENDENEPDSNGIRLGNNYFIYNKQSFKRMEVTVVDTVEESNETWYCISYYVQGNKNRSRKKWVPIDRFMLQ